MKLLRMLLVAAFLAVSFFVAGIGVSAAASSVTHQRFLSHHIEPDATCMKLTGHVGCYVDTTETDTVAAGSNFFVLSASAWTGCSGIYTYVQTYYSWIGLALAASSMKFAYCYDALAGVQVTWGPKCVVNTIIGYGGGVNYCSGNNYPNWPGWAVESWYLYPATAPWYHVNNSQQVLIYATWQSWSGCTSC